MFVYRIRSPSVHCAGQRITYVAPSGCRGGVPKPADSWRPCPGAPCLSLVLSACRPHPFGTRSQTRKGDQHPCFCGHRRLSGVYSLLPQLLRPPPPKVRGAAMAVCCFFSLSTMVCAMLLLGTVQAVCQIHGFGGAAGQWSRSIQHWCARQPASVKRGLHCCQATES